MNNAIAEGPAPPDAAGTATADRLQEPSTLYARALDLFGSAKLMQVGHLYKNHYLRTLPPRILADIYHQISLREDLRGFLVAELSDVDVFVHMLRNGFTRSNLIAVIANLVNNQRHLPCTIAQSYHDRVEHMLSAVQSPAIDPASASAADTCVGYDQFMTAISAGLTIGSFLGDAGWWKQAITFLRAARRLINALLESRDVAPVEQLAPTTDSNPPASTSSACCCTPLHLTQLQCITRLLHAEARYFEYPAANATYAAGAALVERIGAERIPRTLHTMWCAAVSVQYFARSDYDNSNRWGIRAVQLLNGNTPERLAIDVLRQTAKACVLKRQFQRARLLLVQAIKIAAATFGRRHYKYADALMDFAFYLLNVDAIAKSVQIYKEALKIRVALLGQNSLHVAIAQEDLAYALYVHHYSSGNFLGALANVDRSIKVMRALVPATHLFLASAKRVKALILEEIALEQSVMAMGGALDRQAAHNRLLLQSEELHRSALRLSLDTFGEENVMTAKHYGNLGRLYQSMTKYADAERMHNLAIKIKTDILGPWDFEVGLSIGHLASLYNYHMNRYRDAEVLYLRSIDISLKLFGDAYSGLEYDYRGLCNVYEMLDDEVKWNEYQMLLEDWRHRRANREDGNAPLFDMRDDNTLEEMSRKFFELSAVPPADTAAVAESAPVDG